MTSSVVEICFILSVLESDKACIADCYKRFYLIHDMVVAGNKARWSGSPG